MSIEVNFILIGPLSYFEFLDAMDNSGSVCDSDQENQVFDHRKIQWKSVTGQNYDSLWTAELVLPDLASGFTVKLDNNQEPR